MDRSNAAGLAVMRHHRVRAMTDVSGFGLLGHLAEMLRAAALGADVRLTAVPLLPGARGLVAEGLVSSLQRNNELALRDFDLTEVTADDPGLRLLVDPQTSGGLLAAVPQERADACLAELREAGYRDAARVGIVTPGEWRVST
jgi:selenide,water dikinase